MVGILRSGLELARPEAGTAFLPNTPSLMDPLDLSLAFFLKLDISAGEEKEWGAGKG